MRAENIKSQISRPRNLAFRLIVLVVIILGSDCSPIVIADDWPHWRGPNFNDRSTESGLMKEWPEEGPPQKWLFDAAGEGYAGFSVVNQRLYTMGMDRENQFALCIDVQTGKEIWRQPLSGVFTNDFGGGPRGTPSIDGDRCYLLTADGILVCMAAETGRIAWQVELKDFGGEIPKWGFSESPLIDGDLVFCTPGGKVGAVLALNKMTGKKVWQSDPVVREMENGPSSPAKAHYSSMIPIDWRGKRQVVQLTHLAVIGLDAQTGQELWRSDWPGRTAVIPSPIFDNGQIYISSGYTVGSKLIQLESDRDAAEDLWYNNVLTNHHGGVILIDDHFYGSSDRAFICQSRQSGDRVWAVRQIGKGAVTWADDRFYHVQEKDGRVMLFSASPQDGPQRKGSFVLSPQSENRSLRGMVWVHPVISDGLLFLRDQEYIYCFDIREPK